MRNKFVKFVKVLDKRFNVYNHKKEFLGHIDFFDEWKVHKQFVFYPLGDTFFTAGCLKEIEDKLVELNASGGI